ncbi:unnamed protein product [Chilo suppressalis]|uniref:Uncharacterized protein n=1 Tax=Chilo suppressalis TaxID=168631 RepID=A0ABN8BHA4_CHISP|nr:unnamed protein product [Chilo suppressalis]
MKSEQGQLKNVGSENEAIEVRGQFSYTGPDGVVYTVNYVANENGFQAQGAHLPQTHHSRHTFLTETHIHPSTAKMKSFIVFACMFVAALAGPVSQGSDADAQVLRYDSDNIGVDGYKYVFNEIKTIFHFRNSVETSNGISAQEQGQLKNVGSENEAIEVRGQFSYTGPDGVVYTVNYVADENGFQPQGAHLPVAP